MKKLLALLLILLLCAVVVSGCGGDDTGDASTETATEHTTDTTATDDEEGLPPQLPTLEPMEPLGGPGTVVHEHLGVTIQVVIPEGWSARLDSTGENLNLYNAPVDPEVPVQYGSAPTIGIALSDTGEIDRWDDSEPLENRTIGGIEMEGHTLPYGGGVASYLGQVSRKAWANVYIRGIDVDSGEGKVVLDSIRFSD